MTEECCTRCGGATGRAGKVDDSLYFDDYGPFCEGCWSDLFCTRCDGEGEVKVLRNARGELDYIGGSETGERAPCDCCGGKGYIERPSPPSTTTPLACCTRSNAGGRGI